MCIRDRPISVDYRGYRIFQTPPVSQGIIHLEELSILNQFNMSQYEPDSAEAIHLMVEAKKIAFRDRMKYFGDPEFVENPTEILLVKSMLRKLQVVSIWILAPMKMMSLNMKMDIQQA